MQLTLWDILSIILLVALVLVGAIVVQIFINPYSAANPFPPATLPAPIQLPTSTNTPRVAAAHPGPHGAHRRPGNPDARGVVQQIPRASSPFSPSLRRIIRRMSGRFLQSKG